jgi:lipid-A-disaccharide synthase
MSHIVLLAGEPSGDALGGSLIRALKKTDPSVKISGVGGARMEEAGLASLFPMHDLSVMGIVEVIPRLPTILRRIRQSVDYIKEIKPDIVVTIDAPDFSFRVARKIKEEMGVNAPRLVHYVAPTVWAWREGRAARMAEIYDGVMCLFDFEPPYFEKEGLSAVTVGHPIVEKNVLDSDGAIYRDEVGISLREMTVGILMGSRVSEVNRHGPILTQAASKLAHKIPGDPPHLIVPTLPQTENLVWSHLKAYPGPVHITRRHELKFHAFKAMDIAMAVSGTVGLELAVLGTPHMIAYTMNPLTYMLLKRAVKTPYAHLANIILDKRVVPEFIQGKAQPDAIAEEMLALMIDQRSRKRQIEAFDQLRPRLGFGDEMTPSQKAADFIFSS